MCWGGAGERVELGLGGALPLDGLAVVLLGDLFHDLFQVLLGLSRGVGTLRYREGVQIGSRGHLLQRTGSVLLVSALVWHTHWWLGQGIVAEGS